MEITIVVPDPKFSLGAKVVCVADWTRKGMTGEIIRQAFVECTIHADGVLIGGHWRHTLNNGNVFSENQIALVE